MGAHVVSVALFYFSSYDRPEMISNAADSQDSGENSTAGVKLAALMRDVDQVKGWVREAGGVQCLCQLVHAGLRSLMKMSSRRRVEVSWTGVPLTMDYNKKGADSSQHRVLGTRQLLMCLQLLENLSFLRADNQQVEPDVVRRNILILNFTPPFHTIRNLQNCWEKGSSPCWLGWLASVKICLLPLKGLKFELM
jgi:hypothetical protein